MHPTLRNICVGFGDLRDGAIIFRDIAGKLTVLRITCDKCGRSGQYRVDPLIMPYGIDAKLFDWSDGITADCPRSHSKNPRSHSKNL